MQKKLVLAIFLIFLLPINIIAHGVSGSDQQTLYEGGLMSYVWVGAKHMVTGYDHLLFLAGVIFFLKNFKDILLFITAFTIGHSITLITATNLGIKADEHLIDAVIALSVIYKGFENLTGFEKIFSRKPPNLLLMVFIFGLIHGFGLSTRLQSFDMGEDQFLSKIICFNIGIELGQIGALIPIVFIITQWQNYKSYDAFNKAMNSYLIIAGFSLFIYQIYGYFTVY